MIITKRFYKENGMWYIDLPEYLEAGLGTKNNLLMVAGADTLLDILSNNGTEITIEFGDERFDGCNVQLDFNEMGKILAEMINTNLKSNIKNDSKLILRNSI